VKNPLILTTALFTVSAPLLFAAAPADSTWISTSSTTWANNANWSPATFPQPGVGAILADSGTIQHNLDIAVAATSLGVQFSAFGGGAGFTIGSTVATTFNSRAGGTFSGIVNNDDNTQTFNAPMAMFTLTGSIGSLASQTWRASSGPLIFSGIYSGSAATVDNNGGRLTVDGAFNTTIGSAGGRGDIVDAGGLTKSGAGTLTLGGTVANSYSGSTIVNGGSIIAAKASAFGNGSSALTLNGGTVNSGGFSHGFGTLSLTAESTLDLGAGTSALTFAASSGQSWSGILHILNFTQGTDSIRVGTTSSSLTFSQLSEISWDDQPGINQTIVDSNGFLVPIPEPSTVTLSVLGGFGIALALFNRRKKG
jgi:fibronectin-binding autotransporter adhesin